MKKDFTNTEEAERLIHLIKNRNKKAASYLYDQYAPILYGWILSQVNNKKDAENLLINTFLSIWINAYLYDPKKCRPLIWMMQLSCKLTVQMKNKASSTATKLIDPN